MKSEKRAFDSADDDDQSIPVNTKQDVGEDVIMMIVALAACELSRTEAQNAGDNLLASSTNGDTIVEPLRRITNSEPPKRFRRRGALWASITRRMLFLARESARPQWR